MAELTIARRTAGVSQATLARQVGTSQSDISRIERLVRPDSVSVVRLCEIGSQLGLELSARFYPAGDPIRDAGHQALVARFLMHTATGWTCSREVPFPSHGDPRAWDILLRVDAQRVGVEVETRIRDVQQLARRIHERQRDGGVDHVVLVLSDSAANRRLLPQLVDALGPDFRTSPRAVLASLRRGRALPGSAVVLV